LDSEDPLAGFVVRKEAKTHGLQKWVEGIDPRGKRVAVVDDVITQGGSVLRAVERAREAGADVEVVLCLVDREEGGRAAVERQGVPFLSICTLSQIQETVGAAVLR
jgi:orotate phosphoribosyltransferase